MSLKEAIEYAEFGWSVFPLLPRSKAPSCAGGFHSASKNITELTKLWNNQTNLNVGIATGEPSGVWVLDIDPDKGGDKSLEELEAKYGTLPETLVSETGGGGKHYVFKMPSGVKIPCSIGKLAKGVDVRGDGGYIAAPPSIHPNGNQYQWGNSADVCIAPDWLMKLILALKKTETVATKGEVIGDWTTEDVLAMLEVITPDDRDVWIHVGMALHEGGWPVTIWDTWSRDSEKYKMGEPFRVWKGFKPGGGISMGTLVHMAQEAGWNPPAKPHEELDFSNIDGVDLSAFKKNVADIPLPEVETKIAIGGLIGDTLAWINSTAMQPQPELAILNIFSSLGAVFGRRYALQKLDTRTNLYAVGIAGTSQGKNNSRQKIKKLMRMAGLYIFLGPDGIKTAQGLAQELKKRPSLVFHIDEMGMVLKHISDPKAPIYVREIASSLLTLYSDSNSTVEYGLLASAPDERITLHEPNLCIYGTTTLSKYADAMRSSSISSGELNRFITIQPRVEFPERLFNFDSNVSPPEELISRWSRFKTEGLAAAPDIIEQEKTLVLLGKMEESVNNLFRFQDEQVQKYRTQGIEALWGRYAENCIKIAMIIAIARDPVKPALLESDITFGRSLIGSSMRFMIKFASDNMYDGDFQSKCAKFMEALDSGCDTRTKMMRRMKLKDTEMNEIERTLREMEKISFDVKERPRTYILK